MPSKNDLGRTIGLESLRLARLDNPQEKGHLFEELLQENLPSVPDLELIAGKCWRWKNLPPQLRTKLFSGTTNVDIGIDLVAQKTDGSYVAIQAKCVEPSRKLKLSDLHTAINAAAWRKNIGHCWLITTGEWSQQLEQQLGEGWSILHASSAWKEIPLVTNPRPIPSELDDLQKKALRDVLKGYKEGHQRGRLIMACGTGKTLVSQRVAEEIVPNNGIVLYATPSIALTGQSRRAWLREAKRELRTIVVCSQADAGESNSGYVGEIEAPATTDPKEISKLVRDARRSLDKNTGNEGGGMVVIFSTYQSMPKIIQAQDLPRGLPPIDLAIADEAHRTAGIVKNKEAKAFQAIHHELKAKLRLYQTATPRIYSTRSVKRLIDGLDDGSEVETRVIDMRNDLDFGPEFHRLTFREALSAPESQRRLVDYEIIVVTIQDYLSPESIAEGVATISNTSMYQRMAAVGLALFGQARTLENKRPVELIHSCIGYCNTLKAAREVTRVMGDDRLRDWVYRHNESTKDKANNQVRAVTSGYIDGKTRAPLRFQELSELESAREKGETHITMNAKVLTEGVDVPALDAVCFMEPRDSEIDIVQAVGRVMRKPKKGEKNKGYIIIPVVLDKNQLLFEDADETLARWNQDWRVLGQVLRALKSHDPSIETDLEKHINIRTTVGGNGNGNGRGGEGELDFWNMLRKGVFDNLLPTIQAKLNEETENEIQTSLIKQAVISGARSIQNETGLAKRIASTVGVADSTNEPEKRACLQASLILTNTLLMHQRLIEKGSPESNNLDPLSSVHTSTMPEALLLRSWRHVLNHDYRAIFEPGVSVIEQSLVQGQAPEGLRSALRTLSEHCLHIATKYAELGMDQAGELFQAAMDEADAEGAYYTLSPSAMLLAELACDARAPEDDPLWADARTWQEESIVDPACGSGTLLAAIATSIRRRGDKRFSAEAESNLIERALTGLDRNSHALQIAGTQLAIQSTSPSLSQLGFFTMPWGRTISHERTGPEDVGLGSLELLTTDHSGNANYGIMKGQKDEDLKSEQVQLNNVLIDEELHPRLNRAVIGISNPPYTKGAKVDKNVTQEVRKAIQVRRGLLAEQVEARRNDIGDMLDSDSLRPWFSVILEEMLDQEKGVIAKVMPTTACTAADPSERIFWAKHFEILYIITLHNPKTPNWSVDTGLTESLMIGRRKSRASQTNYTKFISLRRRPKTADEVLSLRDAILSGSLSSNSRWGNVTICPQKLLEEGDWSAAVWYDPELSKASWYLDDLLREGKLVRLGHFGDVQTTKETVGKERWEWVDTPRQAEISVARSASMEGFKYLSGRADGWARRVKKYHDDERELHNLKKKVGHLLITNTQNAASARLAAFVSAKRIVGYTWTPIQSVTRAEAEALAIWLNSSPGAIAMRKVASRDLKWPFWQPRALANVVVPNIRSAARQECMALLRKGFAQLKDKELDLYREGYTPLRMEIDAIVSQAMGISRSTIRKWGRKLAEEPTIQGVSEA